MLSLTLLMASVVLRSFEPYTADSPIEALWILRHNWLLLVLPALSLLRLLYFHFGRTNALNAAGYPEVSTRRRGSYLVLFVLFVHVLLAHSHTCPMWL